MTLFSLSSLGKFVTITKFTISRVLFFPSCFFFRYSLLSLSLSVGIVYNIRHSTSLVRSSVGNIKLFSRFFCLYVYTLLSKREDIKVLTGFGQLII